MSRVVGSTELPGIGEVFARHADELVRFLRCRRSEPEASDLVQEGFLRLLKSSTGNVPGNARAWLYRTCSNLAADARDYRRVREAVHATASPGQVECIAAPASDPAAWMEATEQLQCAWQALLVLPAPVRQAFLLNRLEGMSQREIARHMNLSEKTVERHVLRALEACHDAVDDLP
jgi:RNA polymerase sigma factor (sigma-70 family)